MSLLPEDPDDDWQIDRHFIEEVKNEDHDHRAMGVNLRGLSESRKEIVIQCAMVVVLIFDFFDEMSVNLPIIIWVFW
jgi:hypothetical protein